MNKYNNTIRIIFKFEFSNLRKSTQIYTLKQFTDNSESVNATSFDVSQKTTKIEKFQR